MTIRARRPVLIPPGGPCVFPDPTEFDAHGLIAGGGDLSPARLLAAYRAGIFPWCDEPPILWWSPDPRAVLTPSSLHVSRSLKRRLQSRCYMVTCNQDPEAVLDGCAERRTGTWLHPEMKSAYLRLHALGHLVSFEVWENHEQGSRELVGGLYGVLVDGLFAAESKFHRKTDASKVALVGAVLTLFARGLVLFDVQFTTEHLASLGAHDLTRSAYLAQLAQARRAPAPTPPSTSVDLVPELLASLKSATPSAP